MINPHLTSSCAVALPRERNRATASRDHATGHATENATCDLKALAERVLERNRRNRQRNSDATTELQAAISHATSIGMDLQALLLEHRLTLEEIQAAARDDFADCEQDWTVMEALVKAVRDHKLMRQGNLPSAYTAIAYCRGCRDVYLSSTLAACEKIIGCPWCWNQTKDLPIPRPPVNSRRKTA